MGGRGTFSVGKDVAYTYEKVDEIAGVKVLEPMDKRKSLKLPDESHSSNARYIVLDKTGVFHQYREYDENHKVVLEIGYHLEPKLGKGKQLHIHIYHTPGVENHAKADVRHLNDAEKVKYRKFFRGLTVI